MKRINIIFALLMVLCLSACTVEPVISDPFLAPLAQGELRVCFLDVGQGDCIFIEYEDYHILIDAGDNQHGDEVVNFLSNSKVDDLEIAIATHMHADHIGGLDDVIKQFPVEVIIDSGEKASTKTYWDYWDAVVTEGCEYLSDDDMEFKLDDNITFTIIDRIDNDNHCNNNSVICRLEYEDVAFLFTGDAEDEALGLLMADEVNCDVFKASHHGSNSSAGLPFLLALDCELVVISCAMDNHYGHPHEEALLNFATMGVNVYGTHLDGDLIFITDGEGYRHNGETLVELPEIVIDDGQDTIEPETNGTQDSSNGVVIESVDLSGEVVVIANHFNIAVNLEGWTIISTNGNQCYTFDEYLIYPEQSVSIYSGKGTGDLKWTGAYIWNNDGDPAELYDGEGILVDRH